MGGKIWGTLEYARVSGWDWKATAKCVGRGLGDCSRLGGTVEDIGF